MGSFITNSAKETEKLGEKIAKKMPGRVFALTGELGSGKTTFVKGFAKALGIKKRVLSSSFVLMKQYCTSHPRINLYHIDLYRLEAPLDVRSLGLEELFGGQYNVVIIEWAEKIKKVLPKKRMEIYFEHLNKNKRRITIKLFNHDDHLSIQP